MRCYTTRIKAAIKELTIEPIIVLYFYALFTFSLTTGNLYLQKLCMPDAPPDINAVCHDTAAYSKSTDISTLRTSLRDCAPGVLVLLAGAWRDRTGMSKPLIMLAICGEILATVVTIFSYQYWSSPAMLMAAIEGSIITLTGGKSLVLMACSCHLIEKTSNENRTTRITYMVTALLFGGLIATGTNGLLLTAVGYKYFYVIVILLQVIALYLTTVFIKDNPKPKPSDERGLLNLSALKVIFKKRENNGVIWMMILSYGLMEVTFTGEASVSLLFLENAFGFSVSLAGYYSSFRVALSTISILLIGHILINTLKLGDCKVGIVSAMMSVAGAVSMAFARTKLELILYAFLDILRCVLTSVVKSILSKFIKPEEIGIYFSFESIVAAILPLIFLPGYASIFNRTLDTLPGAFYLLSGLLEFGILIFVSLTYCIYGEPNGVTEKVDVESGPYSAKEPNCDKFEESQSTNLDIKTTDTLSS